MHFLRNSYTNVFFFKLHIAAPILYAYLLNSLKMLTYNIIQVQESVMDLILIDKLKKIALTPLLY